MNNKTFSPKAYVMAKSRTLPVIGCLINENWQQMGTAIITVIRQQPSGKLIAGLYLTDIFCMGLKNTNFFYNQDPQEFQKNVLPQVYNEEQGLIYTDCEPMLAYNIIYGSISYAQKIGFKANKEFEVTQHIIPPAQLLKPRDVSFGKNGKPFYIVGPMDDAKTVITRLKAKFGEGNYEVFHPQTGEYIGNDPEMQKMSDNYDEVKAQMQEYAKQKPENENA